MYSCGQKGLYDRVLKQGVDYRGSAKKWKTPTNKFLQFQGQNRGMEQGMGLKLGDVRVVNCKMRCIFKF